MSWRIGNRWRLAGTPTPPPSSTPAAPLRLTVANAARQTGTHWTDAGSFLQAAWPAGTAGVVGVNNHQWGTDTLFWDLSALVGAAGVSDAPSLSLSWETSSGPAEPSVLGFGFCVAADVASAAPHVLSRWANLHHAAGSEGVVAKWNQSTGQTASTKASPGTCRLTTTLFNNRWAFALAQLAHGDTGANPTNNFITAANALDPNHRLYAWLSGGPASEAVGAVGWGGALTLLHCGG